MFITDVSNGHGSTEEQVFPTLWNAGGEANIRNLVQKYKRRTFGRCNNIVLGQ
jgi:hypothetical protein